MHPHNAPQQEVVEPVIAQIEARLQDIEGEKSAYMLRCKAIRQTIKTIIMEAKDEHGVRPRALRKTLKERGLIRKLEDLVHDDDLEEEDAAQFDYLHKMFGADVELPLFKAAADEYQSSAKADAAARRARRKASKQIDLEDLDGGPPPAAA